MHVLRTALSGAMRRRILPTAALAVLCGVGGPAAAAPLPDRVWGTYFGGISTDTITAATLDEEGNIYIAGVSFSKTGIATPGSYNPDHTGQDAFLAKFSPDGSQLWGTYFGGPGVDTDSITGIAARSGRVVIVGSTLSSQGIAMPGAFQATKLSGYEGFAASFTAAGALEWSTYIGGAGNDGANALVLDAEGSAYVVGAALGEIAGLATPGTHQSVPGGGQDPYIVKFDAQGQRVWGTYYGGAANASFLTVALNALDELYVAGHAITADDALVTAGAHQTAIAGPSPDHLLVRFNLDGTRVWGTYYGGQDDEAVPRLTALPQGGVVLAGTTRSVDGIASADAFQGALEGLSDSFLARFDAAGARVWGTYYGGNSLDMTSAITSDAAGGVYVCGHTFSTGGIVTANAFLTIPGPYTAESGMLFVSKFDDLGGRRWGTYFGDSKGSGESCAGVTVDADYRIHVAGSTNSDGGFATPGTHAEVRAGGRDGVVLQWTQGLGLPCAGPDDCGNGLCVDGMCCDTPCGGGADDCQACSAAAGGAVDGVCTLLGADVTCRAAAGTCDVAEMCSGAAVACPDDGHAPDGESCVDGLCSAGTCTPAEDSTTGDDDTAGNGSTTGDDQGTAGDTSTSGNDSTTGDDQGTAGDTSTSGNDSTIGDVGTTDDQGTAGDTSTTGGDQGTAGDTSDTGSDSGAADGGVGCSLAGDPSLGLLASPLWLSRRRRR